MSKRPAGRATAPSTSPTAGGAAARRVVEGVWAQVRQPGCKGLCADSCGPIAMTTTEFAMLCEAAPAEPFDHQRRRCGWLDEHNRCRGYEQRPLICRLFGAVPDMQCAYGCATSMTAEEGWALMARLQQLEPTDEWVVTAVPRTTNGSAVLGALDSLRRARTWPSGGPGALGGR